MSVRPALSAPDIERSLRRISHEIVEGTPETSSLVLLGIPTRGAFLAHRLAAMVSDITGESVAVGSLDVTLYRDDLARTGHRSPPHRTA